MKKFLPLLLIIVSCTSSEPVLLSEQEYLDFGKQIQKALKSGQPKKITRLYNLTKTYEELEFQVDSLKLKSSVTSAKWKSYKTELNKAFARYIESLSDLAKNNGTVEISKFYIKDAKPHLVFSVQSENNGMDFTDFELLTQGDQTFITDYTSYNTGIQFSESFIWNALNKLEYGWMGGEYMDALSELKNAHVYLQRQQPDRAWVAINRIPEYFQSQSNFQVVKVSIASQLSDSLYVNSLYDWIGYNYYQEGFRHLKACQYYFYFGDTASAKLHVDSLEMVAGKSVLTAKFKESLTKSAGNIN